MTCASSRAWGWAVSLALGACDPGVIRVADDTTDTTSADTAPADTSTPDTAPDVAETAATEASDTPADTDADADTDTAPPPLPAESAARRRVFEGASDGVVALPGGLVLVGDAGGWWWVDAAGPRRVTPGDLPVPAAPPRAAALWRAAEGEVLLVASAAGLARLDDGALVATPLGDALAAEAITTLLPAPDGRLWIGTDRGLWRVSGDRLAAITPGALPTADGRLALGARDAQPALWVAAGGQVYALTGGDALLAWPEQPALDARALGADAAGRVWVVDGQGALHVRGADAVWSVRATPEPITALVAHAASPDVWLAGAEHVYHQVGDELRVVDNAPPLPLAPGEPGRLLLVAPDGVDELAPGRVLALLGLAAGDRLVTPTPITLRATDPATVTSAAATLDGAPRDAAPEGEGEARRWQVDLDPATIVNGDHELAAIIIYDDGLTLSARLPFEVWFPTWGDDVADLFTRRCASCHDRVTGASTAVLDSAASWRARIDCIACRVADPFDPTSAACLACDDVTSSMPPTGPLSADDRALIDAWRAGGFRD